MGLYADLAGLACWGAGSWDTGFGATFGAGPRLSTDSARLPVKMKKKNFYDQCQTQNAIKPQTKQLGINILKKSKYKYKTQGSHWLTY